MPSKLEYLLVLALALLGNAAMAEEDAISKQTREWCAAECKEIDSHYVPPENLKNPDAKKLTIIVQCQFYRSNELHNIRPIVTLSYDARKPYEFDLYHLETAAIEAMQKTGHFVYPTMPLKPNLVWTMTYTRQPSKVPPTKVELEQAPPRKPW